MIQQQIEIEEFLEGANWGSLDQALHNDSSLTAHVGRNGSLFSMVVHLTDPEPQNVDRVKELIWECGYRVKGEFPPGYLKITIEAAPKQRQDRGRLERELKALTKLKKPLDGILIYAQQRDLDRVRSIFAQCGFQIRSQ